MVRLFIVPSRYFIKKQIFITYYLHHEARVVSFTSQFRMSNQRCFIDNGDITLSNNVESIMNTILLYLMNTLWSLCTLCISLTSLFVSFTSSDSRCERYLINIMTTLWTSNFLVYIIYIFGSPCISFVWFTYEYILSENRFLLKMLLIL